MKTFTAWVFRSAASFSIVSVPATSRRDALARLWRTYPTSYTISVLR